MNLTESREKWEKFRSQLSLEGGGQGRTSPGLKLSFPAPFPGAGSHPWTTSTHPARKVAWLCFSWDGATGIKEVFPDPALPPGVSAPGLEPGGTFPRECGAPPAHPAWGFHGEQGPLLTQILELCWNYGMVWVGLGLERSFSIEGRQSFL